MISSVNNARIKEIMKLKQAKYRKANQQFLVEGDHLVEEALKYGYVDYIIKLPSYSFKCDQEILEVSEAVLEKLSFVKTPQPIMAVCHMKKQELIDTQRYLLMDGLQDPGNIGTLIRTALAFNYSQIILSENTVDLYNDKLIRASQGAIFRANIVQTPLKEAVLDLKSRGVKVVGTALYHSIDIDQCTKSEKMAIVVGNEGNGMSREILEITDQNVIIPISSIESLNVGVAGAIAMFYFQN